jgi:hypothetical protein
MANITIEAEIVDADEQAALNSHKKLNSAIATYHVEILKRIQRLEKLGGSQDYTHTVMEALKAFDGTVNLTFLGMVLPDHALLTAARKQLAEKGMIIEIQEKNRKILKLVSEA